MSDAHESDISPLRETEGHDKTRVLRHSMATAWLQEGRRRDVGGTYISLQAERVRDRQCKISIV